MVNYSLISPVGADLMSERDFRFKLVKCDPQKHPLFVDSKKKKLCVQIHSHMYSNSRRLQITTHSNTIKTTTPPRMAPSRQLSQSKPSTNGTKLDALKQFQDFSFVFEKCFLKFVFSSHSQHHATNRQ